MTTEPLHVLAERVWSKHPELRPTALSHCRIHGWWLGTYLSDDTAYMLIEAACWRMLPEHWWNTETGTRDIIIITSKYGESSGVSKGPTRTHAILAACEAQEKRA